MESGDSFIEIEETKYSDESTILLPHVIYTDRSIIPSSTVSEDSTRLTSALNPNSEQGSLDLCTIIEDSYVDDKNINSNSSASTEGPSRIPSSSLFNIVHGNTNTNTNALIESLEQQLREKEEENQKLKIEITRIEMEKNKEIQKVELEKGEEIDRLKQKLCAIEKKYVLLKESKLKKSNTNTVPKAIFAYTSASTNSESQLCGIVTPAPSSSTTTKPKKQRHPQNLTNDVSSPTEVVSTISDTNSTSDEQLKEIFVSRENSEKFDDFETYRDKNIGIANDQGQSKYACCVCCVKGLKIRKHETPYKAFKDGWYLKCHYECFHSRYPKFGCQVCEFVGGTEAELEKHYDIMKNSPNFQHQHHNSTLGSNKTNDG